MTTRIGGIGSRCLLGLLALGALGAAGCGGKTSFFEVTVSVNTMVDRTMITSCQMNVTAPGGGIDGPFTLDGCARVTATTIGVFQYGTDAESGTFAFSVDTYNGSQVIIGHGTASGPVKSGGRMPLSLTVNPP